MSSMAARVPLTLALLQSYYSGVYNLRVYLSQILVNADAVDLVQDGDSQSYTAFLNGTYVALNDNKPQRIRAAPTVIFMGTVGQ